MEARRNTYWGMGLLLVAWMLILGWQVLEHSRVKAQARVELRNRAKDISTTVGIVLRSQRRFGVISKERIESALSGLIRPQELSTVALLNAAGEIVAAAPTNSGFHIRIDLHQPEQWGRDAVTIINLVDLGSNVAPELESPNPTIVLSRENFNRPGETNRPPPEARFHAGPPEHPPGGRAPTEPDPHLRGREGGRFRFGRPPWMSEPEFRAISAKQGVHSFLLILSTRTVQEALQRDLWLRCVIVGLATLSVGAIAFAWRKTVKTADLQIRLVRASEMNSHLKEMNLAAAGLAHETRNPLNIIRGLAQMVSKRTDTPDEVKTRALEIVNEADRVAGQLNEFINYSRPREVRRTPVGLNRVAEEVGRALSFDIAEKQIQLRTTGDVVTVEADEPLLRQALFNLVINAVQAVAPGGQIEIRMRKDSATEATLEVRDDGPGVPAGERVEIFKPYFTTTQQGTGLGLAVAQQIVLAHGWEIECGANEPRGACFRIQHLKLAR
ncbi:MAG TPA: ATP-binding protein [Verrucomicrobiota bacterium]|nr:ATP-binding protein [Verrucomicrobiota bacterium]HNT14459.1 ATP-binding protein [Verrucomicrobiota bacterium]